MPPRFCKSKLLLAIPACRIHRDRPCLAVALSISKRRRREVAKALLGKDLHSCLILSVHAESFDVALRDPQGLEQSRKTQDRELVERVSKHERGIHRLRQAPFESLRVFDRTVFYTSGRTVHRAFVKAISLHILRNPPSPATRASAINKASFTVSIFPSCSVVRAVFCSRYKGLVFFYRG